MTHAWNQHRIDRYFERRLGRRAEVAMRDHLSACGRCQARYRRQLMAEALLPDGDGLAEARLWAGIERAAAAAGRGWAGAGRTLGVVLALGAATGGLLLLAGQHAPAPRAPALVERGPGGALALAPALHVFRVPTPGRAEPAGQALGAGEGLVFAYSNPGSRYGWMMVFGVDEDYRVYWFYPAFEQAGQDPESPAIARGRSGVELGEEIRHRFAGGRLRLFALFLEQPARVSAVEADVEASYARPRVPLDQAVTLPVSGHQSSWLFEVTP
jgi:hypothetical protein